MSGSIRLIASDLDGTLLRRDRTVSDRTRAAIAAAQAAGIVVAIATARHPLSAARFAAEAGVSGLAICVNGAIVYDLAGQCIVHQHDLPAGAAAGVIRGLRTTIPDVAFGFVRGMDFACEPAYAELATDEDHGRRLADVPQGDALELLHPAPTKMVVRHHRHTPADLHSAISELGLDTHEATLSGAPFVDVVAQGISKASALREIAADMGIGPDQVMAFGDAHNDLQMLRWAGHAVTVANAHPDVLAEVPAVTASNDDDGVALAIERLLANQPAVV